MKGFHLKRAAGFSLLELMVVVAIIGVLATVAVPRFNIFRARARQGEAKSNLGVIFTLQEAFKIDKEKYFDGDSAKWGGADMKAAASSVGYRGGATVSDTKTVCEANKLGFRLANCSAARYQYWIQGASEQGFLAVAHGLSDNEYNRIFPGCAGSSPENRLVASSKSGKRKCSVGACVCTTAPCSGAITDPTTCAGGTGYTFTGFTEPNPASGDAFCLDHSRTVDNFMDIVGAGECVN